MGDLIQINRSPYRDESAQERFFDMLRKAQMAFHDAEYEDSEFHYLRLRAEFPERMTSFFYRQLSDARLYQKDFRGAAEILEERVEADPSDLDLTAKLALLYVDRWEEIRNPIKALRLFSRIYRSDPDYRTPDGMHIGLMLAYTRIEVCL